MTTLKLKKEQQFAVEISIGNKIRARVEPGGTLEVEDDYVPTILITGLFEIVQKPEVQETAMQVTETQVTEVETSNSKPEIAQAKGNK